MLFVAIPSISALSEGENVTDDVVAAGAAPLTSGWIVEWLGPLSIAGVLACIILEAASMFSILPSLSTAVCIFDALSAEY